MAGLWGVTRMRLIVLLTACACAVAGAAVVNGWCDSPVTVHLAGGDLLVELDSKLEARLTGSAQEICIGELSREWLAG